MNRVTEKHLQAIVDRINRMLGTPAAPYAPRSNPDIGGLVAQIGNYHLSHAYGGVALHQMLNGGGGVRDVLNSGHVPKRELQTAMYAFIQGLETAANNETPL